MTQHYIIAKYADDVMRMEPRNIGVILWSNGSVASRFLQDQATFVTDKDVYNRWVAYWSNMLTEGRISLARRRPMTVDSPQFLSELVRTQKGNYLLYEAGAVLDDVPAGDVQQATDFLFDELVATKASQRLFKAKDGFEDVCDRLFEYSKISERDDWLGSQVVECDVMGVVEPFQFHYVIGNGTPDAVFQRVRFKPQSIHNAAFMFEWAGKKTVKRKAKRAALVNSANEQPQQVSLLKKFATVIDVSDFESALRQAKKVAA